MSILFGASDLHLEFNVKMDDVLPYAHILILAGDIGNPINHYDQYKQFLLLAKQKYKEVVFIAGNHEFYDCDYNRNHTIELLRKLASETNTHFLDREKKVIAGIEFIGCTLWSIITEEATSSISDFSRDVFKSRADYVSAFVDDFRFLQKELQTQSVYPRVVITHHLPTSHLIHKKFYGSNINSAFYTNILDEMDMHSVKFWYCGHTHEYGKVKYGDTYIIVNPIGYPNEQRKTEFNQTTYFL